MARPEKFGHDYFSFYTRSDESAHEDLLTMISSNGHEGYVAVLELDCLIRGATPDSNGYYIVLDQRNSNKLASITRLSDKKLELIIEQALKIGHYDRDMYNKFGIITSKRIQEDHIITSTKRNNLLIRKDYMLLDKKDIRSLGIKKKMVLIEDFWIWENSDEDIVKEVKNTENIVFNDGNNSVNDGNNSVNDSKNEVFSGKSTQIKINKRKINKKKENETILNSESNSNCNGNCNSKFEGKPLDSVDLSRLHNFLKSFIREELFYGDEMDLNAVNDFLFDLQESKENGGYGYSIKDIRSACKSLRNTLRNKNEEELCDIGDWEIYMKNAILNSIRNKTWADIEEDIQEDINEDPPEAPEQSTDESSENSESEELEKLKIERFMKKNKCTYEEAVKIMRHESEVRKSVKIGDDIQ